MRCPTQDRQRGIDNRSRLVWDPPFLPQQVGDQPGVVPFPRRAEVPQGTSGQQVSQKIFDFFEVFKSNKRLLLSPAIKAAALVQNFLVKGVVVVGLLTAVNQSVKSQIDRCFDRSLTGREGRRC